MSIDDDSFDVEEALKGKPEEVAFDRFSRWAYALDREIAGVKMENRVLRNAIKIVGDVCD